MTKDPILSSWKWNPRPKGGRGHRSTQSALGETCQTKKYNNDWQVLHTMVTKIMILGWHYEEKSLCKKRKYWWGFIHLWVKPQISNFLTSPKTFLFSGDILNIRCLDPLAFLQFYFRLDVLFSKVQRRESEALHWQNDCSPVQAQLDGGGEVF